MKEYRFLKSWLIFGRYYDLTFWPRKWGLYARRRHDDWFICVGPFLLTISPFPF